MRDTERPLVIAPCHELCRFSNNLYFRKANARFVTARQGFANLTVDVGLLIPKLTLGLGALDYGPARRLQYTSRSQ